MSRTMPNLAVQALVQPLPDDTFRSLEQAAQVNVNQLAGHDHTMLTPHQGKELGRPNLETGHVGRVSPQCQHEHTFVDHAVAHGS